MTHVLLPEALRWRITRDRHDVASERSHYTCKFIERKCVEMIEYELVPSLRKNAHHQPDGEEPECSSYTRVNGKKIKNFNVF